MADKDEHDEYNNSVAVPFLPRKWLDGFTVVLFVLIVGFLCLKYWVGWKLLGDITDTFLGDISILTTVIFSGTFIAGRVRHWRTHKDVAIGKNKVLDDVKGLLDAVDADTSLTDHEKLERIRKYVRR